MEIIVKAHHVEITSELKDYAKKKMEKLERYDDHIQTVTIELLIEGTAKESDQQVANGTILGVGTTIHATSSSSSLYASIDGLLDKLEIQVKRHKEKQNSRRNKTHISKVIVQKPQNETVTEIKKHYYPKPMDPEEAAEILSANDLNFIIFRNIPNEKICVLHPINDSELELIET